MFEDAILDKSISTCIRYVKKGLFGQNSKSPIYVVLGLKQCYESKTEIYLRFYAVIPPFFTSISVFLTAAILSDKDTKASVVVWRHHTQTAIYTKPYDKGSRCKDHEHLDTGMKIGGDGLFDMSKR